MSEPFAFNARNVEPAKPRDNTVIPNGWYRAWIIGTEMKPNNAGTGRYLEITWEIVEGPHEKRRIWDRLNLENPSEVAVKIAREQLSAICHATGVLEFKHPGELHGEVCAIKVGVERKKDQPDRNKIFGYVPDGDPRAKVAPSTRVGAGAPGAVRGAAVAADDDALPF